MGNYSDQLLKIRLKELRLAIQTHDPETRFEILARMNLALNRALGRIDERTYQFAKSDPDVAKVLLNREVKARTIELEARKK